MTDRASTPPAPPAAAARLLALLFAAAALVLGGVKLARQRSSPPAWASAPIHQYEGYVSIDGYSQRAAFLRERLAGGPAEERASAPDVTLHATSWLVPLAVALASFATGSIPLAFALLSGLASAAQILLVGWLARRLDPGRRAEIGWLGALAAAGHCLTMRSAVQLTLDPFCAAWITATLLVSLRFAARRRGADLAWLALLATSGLFLKSSFLPALAFPTACAWLAGERAPRRLLGTLVLTALVPVAVALLFQRGVFPGTSASDDFAHLAAAWRLAPRELAHFALEMALLFQLHPLAFSAPATGPDQRAGLLALVLVLAGTWVFGLPAVPRLYLPAVGLLVALTVPRIHAALGPRTTLRLLAASGLVNVAIASAGLWAAS